MNKATIVGDLTADPLYKVSQRSGHGSGPPRRAVNRRRFDRESGVGPRPAGQQGGEQQLEQRIRRTCARDVMQPRDGPARNTTAAAP